MSETSEPTELADVPDIARHLGLRARRGHDGIVSTWYQARGDLAGPSGEPRLGVVAMAAEGACVLQGGLAVSEGGRWVHTTDLRIERLPEVEEGAVAPSAEIRVDAELVRATKGATTTTFAVLGAAGANIAVGTSAGRPFETEWHSQLADMEPGTTLALATGGPPPKHSIIAHLGIHTSPDNSGLQFEVREELRNRWGAVHGGVYAIAAEEAALLAVADALTSPVATSLDLRLLEPSGEGPIRVQAEVVHTDDTNATVRVEIKDLSMPDAVLTVATLSCVGKAPEES
jgi:uncharacterized protein (TIGR00369 family)